MEIVAIIPARGGSKGLPNKNLLPLAGIPLMAYSIKAAQLTPSITRIIVSTDSGDIAHVAKEFGAEVPFIRPAEFAQDLSTDLEVFTHALKWLAENENYHPDLVVQLRPTSPVRKTEQIEAAIERMKNNGTADSLRIVTPAPANPYKMWSITDENSPMQPLINLPGIAEPYNMPRQSLPQAYWQIGYLDVFRPHVVLEQHSMSGNTILPFIVSNDFAIDIDDLESFNRAEKAIEKVGGVRFN